MRGLTPDAAGRRLANSLGLTGSSSGSGWRRRCSSALALVRLFPRRCCHSLARHHSLGSVALFGHHVACSRCPRSSPGFGSLAGSQLARLPAKFTPATPICGGLALIHRSVCIAGTAALSFPTCPSARTFPKSTQCGLTRRSTGPAGYVFSVPRFIGGGLVSLFR